MHACCAVLCRWVPITYTNEVSWLQELMRLLPTLLLIGGYVWFTRRQLGGLGGMGESSSSQPSRTACCNRYQTCLLWSFPGRREQAGLGQAGPAV